jgi:hypothetical protein
MSSLSRPPLTLPEYERLFRTIHAVVENEGGIPSKACLFFGIAGAYLLSRHHRLKTARPVAGIAGYNLRTPTNLFIAFAADEDGELISNEDHFHCWIEVNGWIIDFTAPLFNEMAPAERKGAIVPRLMFQKPAITDVSSFESLNTPGAYIHVPNAELTTALMSHFSQKPAYSDLIGICEQWYVCPPKKMAPSVGIGDQHGNMNEVRLSRIRLGGAW